MTREEFSAMIEHGFVFDDIPANRQSWFPELQGWFTDRECALFAAAAAGSFALEIGSWKGRSALAAVYGGAARVMCVDTWRGDEYTGAGNFWPEFAENAKQEIAAGKIVPVNSDWRRVSSLLDMSMFDIVHYDADHSAEALRDFRPAAMDIVHRHQVALLVHDCDYPETREFIRSLNGHARFIDRLALVTREKVIPIIHQHELAFQLPELED